MVDDAGKIMAKPPRSKFLTNRSSDGERGSRDHIWAMAMVDGGPDSDVGAFDTEV